jgi:hypothetical protein
MTVFGENMHKRVSVDVGDAAAPGALVCTALPLVALAAFTVSTNVVMAVGVLVAKLSQLQGGSRWTPGAVWGATLVVVATLVFVLVARLTARGAGACGQSRAVVVLSTVLVFMCAWAAFILVFAVEPGAWVRP